MAQQIRRVQGEKSLACVALVLTAVNVAAIGSPFSRAISLGGFVYVVAIYCLAEGGRVSS